MTAEPSFRSTAARPDFERLDRVSAHHYVADQLRRHIALRLVTPAQSLPSERSLAQSLGVSRTTIQRALALLEADGLIERRRGRAGGTFVTEPAETEPGSAALVDVIREDRAQIEQALAYRIEIEPAAAWHSALTATPDDVHRIRVAADATAKSVDESDEFHHDVEFHIAIAAATGNAFFVEGVKEARLTLTPAFYAQPGSRLWRDRTVREHDEILTAIVARNPAGAREAMRRHVAETERGIRSMLAAL